MRRKGTCTRERRGGTHQARSGGRTCAGKPQSFHFLRRSGRGLAVVIKLKAGSAHAGELSELIRKQWMNYQHLQFLEFQVAAQSWAFAIINAGHYQI